MENFRIGDRIVYLAEARWQDIKGTVKIVGDFSVGIEFDKGKGHNLSGAIKKDTGWWIQKSEYRYIKKINIQLEFDF